MQELKDAIAKAREKEKATTLPELVVTGADRRQVGVKPDFERIANEQAALLEDDLYNGRTMPELVVSAPRTTAGQAERRAFGTSVNEGNASPATTLVVPDETGRLTMAVPAESMPAAQMVPIDASKIASLPVAEQVKEGEKKDPSGESTGKSASTERATTAQTTPAAAGPATAQQVPTWQDLIKELTELDEESEETKAKMRKKQRIAAAIAALGDVATHAINVWGASNGYNAPIKGAPLTEGIANQHKLQLAEHDARLERLKKLRMDAAEARKKDAADKLKLRELHLKEAKEGRAATIDALRLQLDYEKHALDKAKTEDDRKYREKRIELLKAQIKATNAGVQQGWAKVENYKERTKAQNAKAARGKQTAFSDGKGNNLAIYDNVWKGSMQQVYDILEQELRAEDEKKNGYQAKKRWEERNTAAEKNDFVKQNWHKSERARKLMEVLASLDPATMVSTGLGWGEEAQDEQTADENTDLDW